MISKDKTYRTRDGREVRIYATDCGDGEPVHGAVKEHGEWVCYAWNLNGKFILNKSSDFDLIEVKPRIKREYWVNVYPNNERSALHTNIFEANCVAMLDRFACVKVVIDCEEGEGL